MLGTVKWFSNDKGYGFITSGSDEDYYFNVQSVKGSTLASNGDQVEFDVQDGAKGPRAVNVVIKIKARQANSRDDRVECKSCKRLIVPRIITDRGSLDHSVCPFCGTWVKDYSLLRNFIGWVFSLAIKHPFVTAILILLCFLMAKFL